MLVESRRSRRRQGRGDLGYDGMRWDRTDYDGMRWDMVGRDRTGQGQDGSCRQVRAEDRPGRDGDKDLNLPLKSRGAAQTEAWVGDCRTRSSRSAAKGARSSAQLSSRCGSGLWTLLLQPASGLDNSQVSSLSRSWRGQGSAGMGFEVRNQGSGEKYRQDGTFEKPAQRVGQSV